MELLSIGLCVLAMDAASRGVSAMLLAANQRLYKLRRMQRPNKRPFPLAASPSTAATVAEQVATLPSHLGWGSTKTADVLRSCLATAQPPGKAPIAPVLSPSANPKNVKTAVTSPATATLANTAVIKHYPSLGIAALEKKAAPALRVWLACRYLDEAGRGWLTVAQVREQLTEKASCLRLCGWRRLRQLLKAGNGRFWTATADRLWLRGAAPVAKSLGVTAFSGYPVELPVASLTNGIGLFRAHLYGAWHSGRRSNNPIARETQQQLLHVAKRTQRRYCQRAQIKRQRHFGLGPQASKQAMENHAWERGQATFKFIDRNGHLGKPATYIAWQLPNSYGRRHAPSQMGRQKKLQRQLTDLVNQGARGNGEMKMHRCYLPNGKAASQTTQLTNQQTRYWPAKQKHDWRLWFTFTGDKI